MKELSDILKACAQHPGETMALATVVHTSGSSYRRPGARMLVLPDGSTIGSISGGCLEQDVIDKAPQMAREDHPVLLTYDTSEEEDIIFGAGLGCTGVLQILLEPVTALCPLMSFLDGLVKRRESGLAATIFHVEGPAPGQIGDRLLLDLDGNLIGPVLKSPINDKLLADAKDVARTGRSANVRYEMEGGVAEAFIETIQSPAPLVLLGAGYDAAPMVRLAKEMGFHVTLVDARTAYAQRERFPQADEVIVTRPDEELPLVLDERTAAVIMTHSYLTDRGWLKKLLPLKLRYLGLMGPRKRAEKMLHELSEEGISAADLFGHPLHNPVGLDIGAESPEQIALSILAEIQAVAAGHAGGLLRDKKGPIHAPSLAMAARGV